MRSRSGLKWMLLLAAAVVLVVALAVVWAVAPNEGRGPLLLAAGGLVAVMYGALYAIQRRRHW